MQSNTLHKRKKFGTSFFFVKDTEMRSGRFPWRCEWLWWDHGVLEDKVKGYRKTAPPRGESAIFLEDSVGGRRYVDWQGIVRSQHVLENDFEGHSTSLRTTLKATACPWERQRVPGDSCHGRQLKPVGKVKGQHGLYKSSWEVRSARAFWEEAL
jgi:hypothetical protein